MVSSVILSSANAQYNVVPIQEKQSYSLSSIARSDLGLGNSSVYVPITLPEGTVSWIYAISTSKNASVNLIPQLLRVVDQTGISSSLISSIFVPSGISNINTTLKDDKYSTQYYPRASRENIMSGIVKVDGIRNGTYYLELENNSNFSSANVTIEIAAIVKSDKQIRKERNADTWRELGGILINSLKKENKR